MSIFNSDTGRPYALPRETPAWGYCEETKKLNWPSNWVETQAKSFLVRVKGLVIGLGFDKSIKDMIHLLYEFEREFIRNELKII